MSVELKKGTTMELMMASITEELNAVSAAVAPSPQATVFVRKGNTPAMESSQTFYENDDDDNFLSSAIETLVGVLQLLEDNRLTLDDRVDELLSNDDYQSARNLRSAYKSLKNSVEDLLDAIEFVEYYLE